MDPDTIITKRLHISGLLPAITHADLTRRLSTFGTVRNLDGMGKLDALGQPKKFGYATMEGTSAQLARCVNLLSGSIWKGAKLRIGDAKPDYKERISKELAADPEPPRKKKRLGGVEAPDMSLITSANVAEHPGWKVTTMGRMVRPVRMRPAHPLPPVAESALRRNVKKGKKEKTWDNVGKEKEVEGEDKQKKKRRKDPDVRARRRTIDPLRWDSVQLKGMFLDVITAPREGVEEVKDVVQDLVEDSDSSASESEDSEAEDDAQEVVVSPVPAAAPIAPKPKASIPSPSPAVLETAAPVPEITFKKPTAPATSIDTPAPTDLIAEKQSSLSLLNSLFSGADDWGGRESVGSDIDEEEVERLKREGLAIGAGDGYEVEEVPMEEDSLLAREKGTSGSDDEMEVEEMVEPEVVKPVVQEKKLNPQATKLKDLFAPREEEAGFSLLGHLDLDLELDDDFEIPSFTQALPETTYEAPPAAFATHAAPSTSLARGSQFTYDPTLPMFFPLASTFSNPLSLAQPQNQPSYNVRVKDSFVWALPEAAAFHRTETEEQIRAQWEGSKGELTREWKRRCREAGKSRKRRGGTDGD
ncbi:hypothetical protein FIBSPDRAFT_920055 [Athelia psychrophila]|uniref:RRM domain-containing protein n=1 Tax=Athelia psychrophila TaxID=1759441 RepID=A0A166IFQ8_9AGAM|nr:hypothetical protein FIBSPDRAFT_920055 [Fibularhizoctonia sp. CBS 109695]